jgi:hypothetical protein
MYWSRTGSLSDLIVWLLLCTLWWAGGWLLSAHVFRLRSRERLFTGGASGLLIFIVFSNMLAHFLPLTAAYWGTSLLILAFGLVAAWRSPIRPRINTEDLFVWPQILAFGGLLLLYVLINRGLAIFDDFSNLPIVSTIAAGDFPPHFYLNPNQVLDYHYGLHLYAASLVRVGGFYPWSAFDISKALVAALTPLLAWLWYRRYFNRPMALLLAVFLVMLGGGSRWLLLLVPEDTMLHMEAGLDMIGSASHTGPDLYTALASPWKIEGGGPIPFPFAFANGMFSPLLPMAFGGALTRMAILSLLLLAHRHWRPLPGLIYGLLLACLSLTVEHVFVIVWLGIMIAVLLRLWFYRPATHALQWMWVLLPSALLAFTMGGVITETSRGWLMAILERSSQAGVGLPGLTLNWPPTFLSAHLGSLSLADPGHVVVTLAEIGPAILLAPWMTWLSREYIRSRKLLMAGLSLLAAIAFLIPLFLRFTERGRDLARMTEAALIIWVILGIPYVWLVLQKSNKALQYLILASIVVTITSGIALLPPQIVAIARPQPSYYIQEPDALLSRTYWDKLDENAQILDILYPYRPPALFGRSAGHAFQSVYRPLPEFKALQVDPDPAQIASAGYSHFYIDRETWQSMTPEQRRTFQQPCAELVAEQRTSMGDFRRLYDITTCQNTSSKD